MNTAAVALAIKVTADAKAATSEIDQSTSKVSKLGKAGQVAGRLLAAGLLVAVGAAVKFTQAAAEDQAAQTRLANTAQQVTGATKEQVAAMESWITAQGKALGVSDDQLRPALDKLITSTKSVGEAQKAASLAMDISARTGKSLESVSASLAKAYATGSVAALGKYGVATKDAEGKTRSMAAIQKDLAKTYKGAAASAADTVAGKQKRLQVAMGELQEEIGTKLLPVMAKLVSVGMEVVDWISQNQGAALAIIGTFGALLAIVKAVSLATQVYAAVTKAWSAVTKIATAVQAVFNAIMSANPVALIVIAIVALVVALVIAYKKSQTFREIVQAVMKAVSKAAGATVNFIKSVFSKVWSVISGPFSTAWKLISGYYKLMWAGAQIVVAWFRSNWPAIKALIVTPFNTAKTVISKVWDAIKTGFSAVKDKLSTTATAIKDALVTAFNAVKAPVQSVIDAVQSIIDKIQALIDKANSVKNIDLNPLNKIGVGAAGLTAGRITPASSTTVTVNVNVHGFVGNERQLATEIGRVLRRNRVNLGAAA